MKKYIGTKHIQAEPCTLGDFINNTGRNPYANDGTIHSNSEEGYKVVYMDGYVSWSPKKVFEEAYKLSDTFVDRLRFELYELQEKQSKLNAFFGTDMYLTLPANKKSLLQAQVGAMLAYSSILIARLSAEYELPNKQKP